MSSSDIAVSVRGVSKSYTIAHDAEKHVTLAEAALARVRNPLKRAQKETFWALNDVSFDVKKGDVVGIIGRNGAGKSTLLKILSRITGPTTGEIEMKGRIGSLLEVGTGFHPELTGRENIFLNGAILGMRKPEIKKQFDAIVDFSGCEQFLDTPVKRYSSGMYVRLAFAVAAHLSTEILVVDEVLSVGDAEFQKKCLGKMKDVASGQGRTIFFVSHNMVAVESLCRTGLLMSGGRLVRAGAIPELIPHYLASLISPRTDSGNREDYRHRGTTVSIESVNIKSDGKPVSCVRAGDEFTFHIHYRLLKQYKGTFSISLMLYMNGRKFVNLWTDLQHQQIPASSYGVVTCRIPKWAFRNGIVSVEIYSHIGIEVQDWIENIIQFESCDGDYYRSGTITNSEQGLLFLDHDWSYDAAQQFSAYSNRNDLYKGLPSETRS